KDKAAITGNVLSEKRDAVVVDVGYTVLVIPRSAIESITAGGETPAPKPAAKAKNAPKSAPEPKPASAPAVESQAGFYHATAKAGPEKSVRELVNQLGEAVVQVRTPGGLGSGFFINEDG